MKDGFLKVCSAVPPVFVADCHKNGEEILKQILEAQKLGVKVIVFPELALTGATCGDLFASETLLRGALKALEELLEKTRDLDILCAVGLPVKVGHRIFNCCAVFQRGKVLGLTAKRNLTDEERRIFSPVSGEKLPVSIGENVVYLEDTLALTLYNLENIVLTMEIGSDFSGLLPRSVELVQKTGALLILHPGAQGETVVSADRRVEQFTAHSRRLCCGYVCAFAGPGESTTDRVYGGHRLVLENGKVLAEGNLFTEGLTISEIDCNYLQNKRAAQKFDCAPGCPDAVAVTFDETETTLTRTVTSSPFLPMENDEEIAQRVERILDIQCVGLGKRLSHTHCKTAVVGLSGGLDSTLALLVIARAFDRLNLPRTGIHAVSMPCFGTTSRTKSNAQRLAEALGVSFREVSIAKAVTQHFEDIGQSMDCHDVTFENGQARERTQVLMDLSNKLGGMVIGTGDLSELVLGWATYNGDHMSMYGVNGGVPKTLMRRMVSCIADESEDALQSVLRDILDTPVSPELLPAKDGEISQITEELVGPYELHDFFLYHALGNNFTPKKIERLANVAFAERYEPEVIARWLQNFYRRFFQQQFKRSCLPDGPSIGSISVSPRTSMHLPSDACNALWMK